jgi:hypothetical protein
MPKGSSRLKAIAILKLKPMATRKQKLKPKAKPKG